MIENKSLLRDCFASEYLTFRLVAAVLLFAVLLSLAICAEKEYVLQISEQQALGEMQRIEKSALLLHRSGGGRDYISNGNLEVLSLQLPESIKYAAFGTGGDVDLSLKGSRSDVEANLYCFKLKNGRMQSFSSNVKFCAAEYKNGTPVPLTDKPAILYPGSYDVYLELVHTGNQTYVMIFQREQSDAERR